ncbi:hypothetical protein E9232_000727 [Inquilinus ginsengisoli]|uniref:Uncharacterized protein n=1 Tax=Inquilinus ginsengisoli TaxID=363840 RepID=A0ABU1JHZ0_9PROT|nr:hypothetical protein [Inquilinus ginsengisoli]
MTNDHIRHGTTTLFAALNMLDGAVIGRNMRRDRYQGFILFLNVVEAAVRAGKIVHAIMDNYAAQKAPHGAAMAPTSSALAFHFAPTSAPGLTRSKASSPSSPRGA